MKKIKEKILGKEFVPGPVQDSKEMSVRNKRKPIQAFREPSLKVPPPSPEHGPTDSTNSTNFYFQSTPEFLNATSDETIRYVIAQNDEYHQRHEEYRDEITELKNQNEELEDDNGRMEQDKTRLQGLIRNEVEKNKICKEIITIYGDSLKTQENAFKNFNYYIKNLLIFVLFVQFFSIIYSLIFTQTFRFFFCYNLLVDLICYTSFKRMIYPFYRDIVPLHFVDNWGSLCEKESNHIIRLRLIEISKIEKAVDNLSLIN